MERTSASGRAFIDFLYPYLSSFFYASSLSSPAQQSPTLQSCDSGRNDMCPNHSPSDPHCLALSHLFLSSRAFGQRLPAQRRYMLTPLYSTPITDTPEIAITIQNLDTAERRPRMYIGLSSYSLTRGISLIVLNQKFPVHCCVPFSRRPLWWNHYPPSRPMSHVFALLEPLPPLCLFRPNPLPLSYLGDTFTLAAHSLATADVG